MKKEIKISIFIFALFMLISTGITIAKTGGMLKDREESDLRVVSGMISNSITNEMLRPITVAETMSKDANLKAIVEVGSKEEAKSKAEEASLYLESIKEGFGYDMVYAVGDKTKAYFGCDGINRYIDETIDNEDIWYKEFAQTGLDYELEVDTDFGNEWALSVFVNTAVYDDKHKLLGICGVGTEMNRLQEFLNKYEDIYGTRINLIDKTGLIQVDRDTSRIEQEYLDIANLEDLADGECYYEIRDDGNRTITYLEELNWFLVIQDTGKENVYLFDFVAPNIICLIIGLIGIFLVNIRLKRDV